MSGGSLNRGRVNLSRAVRCTTHAVIPRLVVRLSDYLQSKVGQLSVEVADRGGESLGGDAKGQEPGNRGTSQVGKILSAQLPDTSKEAVGVFAQEQPEPAKEVAAMESQGRVAALDPVT